ncbi:hypothetical protein [Hyphococcus sp.]|uniref:hypothetical protein n=1 Tax=Hyphococcus sp. TaxID=2038636 RepID=UPI003CCBF65A
MSARDEKPEAEETEAGTQTLMRGVAPITLRDRLAVLAAAPMAPRTAQKSCDMGLFDLESRRQIDLVDELRRIDREAARNPKPSATGE